MSSGATVYDSPAIISPIGVVVGKPVRAQQWRAAAELSNHVLGRGHTVIPSSSIDQAFAATGAKTDLRFKIMQTIQATHRVWSLRFTVTGATGSSLMRFEDPSGGVIDAVFGAAGAYHVAWVETVSVRLSQETEVVCGFICDSASTKGCTLESASCYEAPRPELELDTDNLGVQLSPIAPIGAIYSADGQSVGGVAQAYSLAWELAARAGLFQFARVTPGLANSSGSAADMFAAPFPLLGRKHHRASTTKTVLVRARVSSDVGTTGEINFTMSSGGFLSLAISAGLSPAWVTGTLDIDAEDNTTSDGRRGAAFDLCTVDWKRSTGAGSVYCESISIIDG